MLLNKDATTDPRVLRESGILRNAGYTVEIYYRKGPAEERLFHKVLSNVLWWASALKFARTNGHIAVHAHDLDTLPIGLLLAKLKGVPCVYDAHESYPDMVVGVVPYGLTRILAAIERRLTKHVDHIVLVNKKIGPLVSDDPRKWVVVMNCPGLIIVNGQPAPGNIYTLGYFGSFERGRFLQGLIDAVLAMPNWRLILAGKGSLKLTIPNNDKIIQLGNLKPGQVANAMVKCDLLSIIFENGNANDSIGTPNRLFEAMALGIPVVANWHTYSGEIVTDTDCGWTLDPAVSTLKYLLEYIEAHPTELMLKGENGGIAWSKDYNSAVQGAKLIQLYDSIKGG
jgi:glycosyltransferase involved in cell wall biosynthesis